MTIRPPTKEELIRLAQANRSSLSEEELKDFQRIIFGLFDSHIALGQMLSTLSAAKHNRSQQHGLFVG